MSEEETQPLRSRLDELADEWLAGKRTAGDSGGLMPVPELINRMVVNPESLSGYHLRSLSDLSLDDAALVRREWPTIQVERRRAVLRRLVELEEEELSLQLGRLLRIALNDDDAQVRRLAVDGLWLGEEVNGDLVGPMAALLGNDPDVAVRAAAARALGAFVLAGELDELDTALAMRAEEALLAVVLNDTEPNRVRSRALESLAYSGEVGIRQVIEDAYYSPDEEMRVSALTAMGRSADVRWRGLVRAELQNPATAMRATAAQACGELEFRAALDDLIELVADEERPVRTAAILALGQIGGKEARDVLEAVRLGDDPEDVATADIALEELMFFLDNNLLSPFDEDDEDWDVEPWERRRDYDEDDLGSYDA